jgi:NADH-quinone oxidoreductase subunit K
MNYLSLWLLFTSALFSLGLAAALIRRNPIIILIGIELMLNAANLNFIGFWRYRWSAMDLGGPIVVIFSIAIAAAEAAVGLAMVVLVYRHFRTASIEKIDELRE